MTTEIVSLGFLTLSGLIPRTPHSTPLAVQPLSRRARAPALLLIALVARNMLLG